MKRILWIGACVFLLLSMVACGLSPVDPGMETLPTEASVPTESTAPAVSHEAQGLEAFDGCYSIGEDYIVQIRSFGGFMILEHVIYEDEETYATWVQEFWPDADAVPADPYAGISGVIQTAVPTQQGTQFLDRPNRCAVFATDAGVCLDLTEERMELTAEEGLGGIHTHWQDLQQMLYDMTPCSPEEGPSGSWYSWDGVCFTYTRLDEDGHFFWLKKPVNKPAQIYDGAWSITEDNCITVVAEMLGTGQFPQQFRIQWEYDSEGFLYLEDSESPLMYDEGGFACLYPYNPQMKIVFDQLNGLCYMEECWGISDSFTDTQGNEIYYSYELPSFLGATDTVDALNAQIQSTFGTLIEDGYAAVQRGEAPYCDMVYWEQYNMGNVLAVIISAYTVDGTQMVAYYYDTTSDTRLCGAEVLALIGVDETTYLDALYSKVKDEVYHYVDNPDSAEAQECIAWTLSADNLNLDRPFALDTTGELFVYVQIEIPDDIWWNAIYPLLEPAIVD